MRIFKTLEKLFGSARGKKNDTAARVAAPFSVVISMVKEFPNEQKIIRKLFDAGLTRFHLRRPMWSEIQLENWLKKIPPVYRERMVLHNNFQLAQPLGLAGIHISSTQKRPRNFNESVPFSYGSHSFNELSSSSKKCSYATFGPVFPVTTKKDYVPQRTPEEYAVILKDWHDTKKCPLLALGGVTRENLSRIREMGFDGFVVVSAIWEAPKPVDAFRDLIKAWQTFS